MFSEVNDSDDGAAFQWLSVRWRQVVYCSRNQFFHLCTFAKKAHFKHAKECFMAVAYYRPKQFSQKYSDVQSKFCDAKRIVSKPVLQIILFL